MYTTQQKLEDRYGAQELVRLTDRNEVATDTIDAAIVADAISEAVAIIDGYLARRYALPLAETPPLIAGIARIIAYWKLHIVTPDEKTQDEYEGAMTQLREIADGTIRLPLGEAEPTETGGTGARVTDRDRPMSADQMKGFI